MRLAWLPSLNESLAEGEKEEEGQAYGEKSSRSCGRSKTGPLPGDDIDDDDPDEDDGDVMLKMTMIVDLLVMIMIS